MLKVITVIKLVYFGFKNIGTDAGFIIICTFIFIAFKFNLIEYKRNHY